MNLTKKLRIGALGLSFIGNPAQGFLYDDFSSGVLDSTKWTESQYNNREFTEQHFVDNSSGRYHVIQSTPTDRETNLTIKYQFQPGDTLDYQAFYYGGSGNNASQILIDNKYIPFCDPNPTPSPGSGCISYWNGLSDVGNQIGLYQIHQDFFSNSIVQTLIRPDGTEFIHTFSGFIPPHDYTINTHTGHDGTLDFEYDNFYINGIPEPNWSAAILGASALAFTAFREIRRKNKRE